MEHSPFPLFVDRAQISGRIKTICQKLGTLVRTSLVNLNMFPLRTFGSHVSRNKAKHLGQQTTRFYLLLLITGFVILTLYTIIQPRTITKTFHQPSFDTYTRLWSHHEDTLQCSCSSISSMYQQFITIQPVFHQVSTQEKAFSFTKDSESGLRVIVQCQHHTR